MAIQAIIITEEPITITQVMTVQLNVHTLVSHPEAKRRNTH